MTDFLDTRAVATPWVRILTGQHRGGAYREDRNTGAELIRVIPCDLGWTLLIDGRGTNGTALVGFMLREHAKESADLILARRGFLLVGQPSEPKQSMKEAA